MERPTNRDSPERPWVSLAALALVAAVVRFGLHSSDQRGDVVGLVPALWLWGALAQRASRAHPPAMTILAVGAALRMVFVGSPPWLSDDLYRYLFEGLALRHGHSPWATSPATLAFLDPALAAQVNHPDVRSVYPPLALAWFALLSWAGGAAWMAQLGAALADLLTVGLLARARPRAGWLYALLPLPVLESAVGGHIDVLAVGLCLLAIQSGHLRPAAAWLTLLGSVATKYFPLVLLPAVWLRLPPVHRMILGPATLLGALALGAWGWGHPGGLGDYATSWSFNGFAWAFAEPLLGAEARAPLVAIGAGVGGWTLWRRLGPLETWGVLGTAFVLLSPTMHPWYALWALVPALAAGVRGWGMTSTALLSSYLVLWTWDPDSSSWAEAPWLWWVTWIPVCVTLGWSLHTRPKARRDP